MSNKKLIYGVGINDANYVTQKCEYYVDPSIGKNRRRTVWRCPFYSRWFGMLSRCYSSKQYQTYSSCLVEDDWLVFSRFKTWMEQQDWENNHLDKDILVPGNKVYSSSTCVFVSMRINHFILAEKNKKNGLPTGVSWHKRDKVYTAQCNDINGNLIHLGYFKDPIEAHRNWLIAKIECARELSKEIDDPRVSKAIVRRYEDSLKLLDTTNKIVI